MIIQNKHYPLASDESLSIPSATRNQPLNRTIDVKLSTNNSYQISPEKLSVRCCSITSDKFLITNDQLYTANIHQTGINHSSTIRKKNEERNICNICKSITQDVNNNDNSVKSRTVASNKTSPIKSLTLKRKNEFSEDSCVLGRASKQSRILKLANEKSMSTDMDSHRSSCCVTELFHTKSIVHIHDDEHRLFSIVSLQTSPNEEELLTQKTKECVDQIYDLILFNSSPNTTNESCSIELIFPLDTRSEQDKINTN